MSALEASSPQASAERGASLLRASRRALREPALLLSVAYIAMSTLGLWAIYWLYRPFGIPIFEYMQPSDILVAGLRDPAYLLLVAAGSRFDVQSLVAELALRSSRTCRTPAQPLAGSHVGAAVARTPEPQSPRPHAVRCCLRGLPGVLPVVFTYTRGEAARLVRGDGQRVALVYAGAAQPVAEPAILIGTTAGWVFVYWPRQRRAEAIAQQSVRSLAYPAIAAAPVAP